MMVVDSCMNHGSLIVYALMMYSKRRARSLDGLSYLKVPHEAIHELEPLSTVVGNRAGGRFHPTI